MAYDLAADLAKAKELTTQQNGDQYAKSTPTGVASIAQPAAQPAAPAPTATPTTSTAPAQGSNPFALSQVMTALQTQYKTNNDLMTNRNIALNALYGMPNTKEQLASLDPTLKKVLASGDKNQIEMQIRLINDQVSGRADTLDQSVQFLTNSYQQQVRQAEDQKQNAINTVLDYAKSVGQMPSVVMKALYPQLAAELGTSLDSLAAPTDGKTQGTMFAVPSLEELGGAQFYKYPNSPQVYTNTGVEVDLATFKRVTGQEGVSDDQVNFSGIKTLNPSQVTDSTTDKGSPIGFSSASGMRTDRHNNPIAAAVTKNGTNQFTQALDKAGISWSYGDAFPDNPNMVTIKLNSGDALEGARAILAGSNAIEGWYLNHTGKAILGQYGISNHTQFAQASEAIQNAIIKGIYQAEGGNGSLIGKTPTPDDDSTLQEDVSSMKSQLDTVKGGDGYVSPEDWKFALSAWQGAGRSAASFKTNFSNFINPADKQDYA